MAQMRSLAPAIQRLIGWTALALSLLCGLQWNAEVRNLLLASISGCVAIRYILSALVQKQKFSILARLFVYIPLVFLGYTVRPAYPLALGQLPAYISDNLVSILKVRVQEYVIRYRDIRTETAGLFSEDNLNFAYADGNVAWRSQELALPLKPLVPAHKLPVVLLRTVTNMEQSVTESLHKISLSSLTALPLEVATQAARQNSLQETAFSQTGLTQEQVELGQLKNADYIYIVNVTRAKLSPGFRIEVTFQEAYSGTLRRQIRGYAEDERQLASLLSAGPSAIIKR